MYAECRQLMTLYIKDLSAMVPLSSFLLWHDRRKDRMQDMANGCARPVLLSLDRRKRPSPYCGRRHGGNVTDKWWNSGGIVVE